jgi:hypothetical protein
VIRDGCDLILSPLSDNVAGKSTMRDKDEDKNKAEDEGKAKDTDKYRETDKYKTRSGKRQDGRQRAYHKVFTKAEQWAKGESGKQTHLDQGERVLFQCKITLELLRVAYSVPLPVPADFGVM